MEAAAAYLGTTTVALRRRADRRTIPFIKDGNRRKFDVVALDNYMAERAVVPVSIPPADAGKERLSA